MKKLSEIQDFAAVVVVSQNVGLLFFEGLSERSATLCVMPISRDVTTVISHIIDPERVLSFPIQTLICCCLGGPILRKCS